MDFVIQGLLSALTFTMDVLHLHPRHVLTHILVLLSAFELTQCSPVTASKGGDRTTFFCKAQGCAANVTYVLCKDKNLPLPTPIQFCKGPPPPNTVCKYDGRAFVSIDSDGICEFECPGSYLETEKCTDQSAECAFMRATPTTPVPEKNPANNGLTVVLLIGGCKFRKSIILKIVSAYIMFLLLLDKHWNWLHVTIYSQLCGTCTLLGVLYSASTLLLLPL